MRPPVSVLRPVAPSTMTFSDGVALAYLALPNAIFLAGWIVLPWGPAIATLAVVALGATLVGRRVEGRSSIGPLMIPVLAIAVLWCVMAGVGHFVFANPDWVVRDAVLRDLVLEPWPVRYAIDGVATLLRAPIGYFLPAALVGKAWGLRAAELALLGWTIVGVVLVFATMLRDRPPLKAALIRIAVFVAFSGMDIVGQKTHYNPSPIGEHLEWWAFLFQYSSITTQLFWVPNHALPGWIAIAWLLGQDARRLPVGPAILFVVLTPLWSPLTAIGLAPIIGVALLRRGVLDGPASVARTLLDGRAVVPVVACLLFVYPYLVAGSDRVASGRSADIRWVGEDIVPRYIEFVLFEFVGFAVLLLGRDRRDPLLWAAIVVLLALPLYRFGPYNDLAMRASIPALVLLALRLGTWLSTPVAATRDRAARACATALLVVGAVTPFMEFARVFQKPQWDLDPRASVIDVTRGTHYLAPADQGWLARWLRVPAP